MSEDEISRLVNQPVSTEAPERVSHGAPSKINRNVDRVSRITGYGELSQSATKAFLGFNHRGFGKPTLPNKDQYGLTFFTRPRLNLSYDNIQTIRTLLPLLIDDKSTIAAAVRGWLDPRGAINGIDMNKSPLVDDRHAFIPLLTNNLITISGWPDPIVPVYTSTPGIRREEWGMVDGVYRITESFELQATFKNIAGDPITMLFNIWNIYSSGVYDGTLMPHRSAIIDNEIDYMSRIYRLTLDHTRTYVQKIAACGACFPRALSLGAHFDYSVDTPFNVQADQITVPFLAFGADYMDPISIQEFNMVGWIFNRELMPTGEDEEGWKKRKGKYMSLNREEKLFFNDEGFPQINPFTHELEIWVEQDLYEEVMGSLALED